MMEGNIEIHHANCFDVLAKMPDKSVDLWLTDPPYGTTNLPFDRLKIDWKRWWQEADRICKPSALQICFGAQPFSTDLITSNRRHYRYSLIWEKTNPVGFLDANVRPLRGHEDILIFCQRFGRVKGVLQSCYNPQFVEGTPYHHRSRSRPAAHYSSLKDVGSYDNPGRRYPTSVLRFARDFPSHHPTAKPVKLLQWLIRTYSHPGNVVFDPFMGSGSTGVACQSENRRFVGVELDEAYFTTAQKRLTP